MLGTLWDGPLRDGRVHPLTLPAPPCSPAHPPSTPVRAGRGTVSTERGTELESGETLRNKLDHVGPHQAAMSGGRLSPRRICLLCDQLTGPTRRRHTEPQSPPMYTPPPPRGQASTKALRTGRRVKRGWWRRRAQQRMPGGPNPDPPSRAVSVLNEPRTPVVMLTPRRPGSAEATRSCRSES